MLLSVVQYSKPIKYHAKFSFVEQLIHFGKSDHSGIKFSCLAKSHPVPVLGITSFGMDFEILFKADFKVLWDLAHQD